MSGDPDRRGASRGPDDVDGASEPGVPTPHASWVKVVTVVVLAVFLLSLAVGALLA